MTHRAQIPTPLVWLAKAALAATAGTLTMDLFSYAHLRHSGGQQDFVPWETGASIVTWSDAATPGLLGKRLLEGALQKPLPNRWARTTNNAVHWATGLGWGVTYALFVSGVKRPKRWWGLILGSAAWLASYVVLPVTGLYKPMSEYDFKTLATDLSTHVAYGLATSSAYTALR